MTRAKPCDATFSYSSRSQWPRPKSIDSATSASAVRVASGDGFLVEPAEALGVFLGAALELRPGFVDAKQSGRSAPHRLVGTLAALVSTVAPDAQQVSEELRERAHPGRDSGAYESGDRWIHGPIILAAADAEYAEAAASCGAPKEAAEVAPTSGRHSTRRCSPARSTPRGRR